MRPLTVITGILLGSSLAITVSLAAVLVVFLFLGGDYPRLQLELQALVHSVLLFFGMTALSALSFYTMIKNHPARVWAQLLMWIGLAGVTAFYWPA